MITEYAGWQINDDKQRELELAILKKQLVQAAQANGSKQPAWMRMQLHRLGVRLERAGAKLQVQVGQCQEVIVEDPRISASI